MKIALRFLLPVLLALAVVTQVRRSSDLMRAQHLLWQVEKRTLAMLRTGVPDKTKLRGNLAALADARQLDYAEVAIPTLMGSQYLMLGELEPARRAYLTANQLEPRPEILVNLGKVNYALGERKRALRNFSQAVRLDARLLQEVPEDFRAAVSDALRSQNDADRANEN